MLGVVSFTCIVTLLTHTAVSGAAQIIGDLVTGRAAESFSHYQSVAYDDSEGIGKVQCVAMVILLTVHLCQDPIYI